MILLLLATLMQQPTVEDRVAAFAKGDAAARDALLKAGAAALRPLQKERDKAPEKIDALVLDIKKAVAYPKLDRDPNILGMKCTVDMQSAKPADVIAYLQEFCGAAIVGAFADADLKAREVDVSLDGATVPQVLDHLGRAVGLDFGFFHNVVVVAKPDSLWGSGKAPPVFGPPAAERQHRTPEDGKIIEQLRKIRVNLDFQNVDFRSTAGYLKEICDIKLFVDDPMEKRIPVFRVKDLSAYDVASLATQMIDLDFMVHEGIVIVGTREAIAKKVAGKK